MQTAKWLLVAALSSAVGRANAEGADCPEPSPRERKVMRDRKLEEWKKDRRKEAASRGERVSHSMLLVTDDGRAIVQEQSKTPAGCQGTYLRVAVSTSACENDSLTEHEFHVGCCTLKGCSTTPESSAYAFVDAVSLEQIEVVRRFMPETSSMTVTDAQAQIKPYRRSDAAPRFREMMKTLPHWTPNGEIGCAEPKHVSGKLEAACSFGGGGAHYRFSLESSSADLTDEKLVWFVTRVEIDRQ